MVKEEEKCVGGLLAPPSGYEGRTKHLVHLNISTKKKGRKGQGEFVLLGAVILCDDTPVGFVYLVWFFLSFSVSGFPAAGAGTHF